MTKEPRPSPKFGDSLPFSYRYEIPSTTTAANQKLLVKIASPKTQYARRRRPGHTRPNIPIQRTTGRQQLHQLLPQVTSELKVSLPVKNYRGVAFREAITEEPNAREDARENAREDAREKNEAFLLEKKTIFLKLISMNQR